MWDFLGVYDAEFNADEYDCLIGPLLTRLTSGADKTAIARYLQGEIEGHFGVASARMDIQSVAGRAVTWWRFEHDDDANANSKDEQPSVVRAKPSDLGADGVVVHANV
jgi:hypothetical protein